MSKEHDFATIGVAAVNAERRMQVNQGHDAAHDVAHYQQGQLVEAAQAYLWPSAVQGTAARVLQERPDPPPSCYPWDEGTWKPGNRLRNLRIAASLLIAEYDRLRYMGQVDREIIDPPMLGPTGVQWYSQGHVEGGGVVGGGFDPGLPLQVAPDVGAQLGDVAIAPTRIANFVVRVVGGQAGDVVPLQPPPILRPNEVWQWNGPLEERGPGDDNGQ